MAQYLKPDCDLGYIEDPAEIEYLKDVFKLSTGEANFLSTCTRGHGLLKVCLCFLLSFSQPHAHKRSYIIISFQFLSIIYQLFSFVNTILLNSVHKQMFLYSKLQLYKLR